MEFGATQGFNSTDFVQSDRFKIESLSLPPELIVVRLPTVGAELVRRLADYRLIMNWIVVQRAEAEGTVRSVFGRDQVQYSPTPTDMAHLRKGLRTLSEMMFAGGAVEFWPGVHGVPTLRSPDDLRYWNDASLDPRDYSLLTSHLFGSARMGADARDAVVGLDFQVHGLRGAYVLDSSIFPTNIGVNPQHTIMAMSRLGAARIIDNPLPAHG
jgi:choline dehydrogenase-like flavoprotein